MCNRTKIVSTVKFGAVGKAYPVERVEECIEEVCCRDLLGFVKLVVNLIQSHGLRIDQRVTVNLSVQYWLK